MKKLFKMKIGVWWKELGKDMKKNQLYILLKVCVKCILNR